MQESKAQNSRGGRGGFTKKLTTRTVVSGGKLDLADVQPFLLTGPGEEGGETS